MKKIVSAVLLSLFLCLGVVAAEAKERGDYLFLVTITRATGDQELIYTDLYVLSGTSTASSVTVGNTSVGSGEETCDSHMKVAVKGTEGLLVKKGKTESLTGVHTSWDIAWNDKLEILSQKYNRLFAIGMQKCPFPLIRMVPDKED